MVADIGLANSVAAVAEKKIRNALLAGTITPEDYDQQNNTNEEGSAKVWAIRKIINHPYRPLREYAYAFFVTAGSLPMLIAIEQELVTLKFLVEAAASTLPDGAEVLRSHLNALLRCMIVDIESYELAETHNQVSDFLNKASGDEGLVPDTTFLQLIKDAQAQIEESE